MGKFINSFYKNQGLIYKIFLFLVTSIFIVYLFPKGGKFKYEIPKGKPWQYDNLYAPFDFAILKTEEEIASERQQIIDDHITYYDYNQAIAEKVKASVEEEINTVFPDSVLRGNKWRIKNFTKEIIDQLYEFGVLQEPASLEPDDLVYLKRGNEATEVAYGKIYKQSDIRDNVSERIEKSALSESHDYLLEVFFNLIKPNVVANESLTEKELQSKLKDISYTKGSVERGTIIVAKGEVVEGEKRRVLESLKAEYESQVWSENNFYWVVSGYTLLVSISLLILLLFIKKYRNHIYHNNVSVTFIFFNVILMVMLTTFVVQFDFKYVYIVPLCILPLTLKAFFDPRLGLFAHVITVLLLGFVVPNSFEYMFLQIIAGIVTILSVSELYKRANLFITVGQITLIYILSYFSFTLIREGDINELNPEVLLMFVLAGLATLFVQPLIYAYEKLFGMVSDMSLLELSDTNTKLLKELSDKAPGTFHHSLNVANLAEAAANEIGANTLLVRVGALYHDIGKMDNPTYFTENQTTSMNPHDDMDPKESASIIINHVIRGIEIGKKNNLPDRIIDFIRTHHGTTTVYYFLKKERDASGGEVEKKYFTYPGPIPFSKETAILMMSDSVEAASKSLKEPTSTLIEEFVEKIINKQMEEGQFLNSDITFKEIQLIKKVLKRKLNNIYHLRVEYPE